MSRLLMPWEDGYRSDLPIVSDAKSALENITGKVSIIQSMNQQIATAAEQQSAVTEEINRAVINVRDISDQTANTCEETAASSNELARLGHELERLVERFKV